MEKFVSELQAERYSELQAERYSELQAYLKATGLDDYELSERERESLKLWSNFEFKSFQLDRIFEKISTNKVVRNEQGDLYATTCTLSNNQLGAKVFSKNATILKNVISVTANGTAQSFYQSHDFTVLQDSYALKLKQSNYIDQKLGLFLVTNINQNIKKYNWNNKSGWEKIKSEKILLPIKSNNEIDYDYINTFINAIIKTIIKDLVLYTNKKLEILSNIIKDI